MSMCLSWLKSVIHLLLSNIFLFTHLFIQWNAFTCALFYTLFVCILLVLQNRCRTCCIFDIEILRSGKLKDIIWILLQALVMQSLQWWVTSSRFEQSLVGNMTFWPLIFYAALWRHHGVLWMKVAHILRFPLFGGLLFLIG